MAPIPRAKDDDFILTLSDDENPGIVADDDVDGEDELRTEKLKKSSKTNGSTKRKRDQLDIGKEELKNKKNKKQKKKSGKKGKEVEEEEKEEEEGFGVAEDILDEDDDALDPDFEFDVGGAAGNGVIAEFDGWGIVDEGVKKGGDKKAVDIDDIISRRQQRKDKGKKKKVEEVESESEGEDDEGEENGFANFDDDELLAPDGFGMGAQGDSEDGSEGDSDQEGSVKDDEEENGDITSDEDRVASPVPHPDDLESDASDDEEDEDPEEAEKRKAFFAPEEKPSKAKKALESSSSSFQDFSLSRPILRGLAAVGFSTPTPIQRKTIPVALLGKDVVGGAVTGSGKTAAFILPILERLLYRPRKVPTSRVAILMPTRELAVQCFNVATKLATFTDITFCQLVGGYSLREQETVLKKRPDVIIATPGRFIDHMRNSASFTVDTLEILVLDEADRMLEDGFADELNEILTTIPKSRQTMLFSATMTDSVDKLIRVGLNRPVRLLVDAKKQTVGTLVQEFVRLRPGREDKRLGYLMLLCKTVYTDRIIIFFRQKKEAHRVRVVFGLSGLKAAELHGSMSQEQVFIFFPVHSRSEFRLIFSQRIKSVEDFRDGKVSFLLATDLASRGLDIKGVETVINYEAPQSHEIYLHRVGRTARAGRTGRACTIAAEPDRKVVKAAVKAGRSQGAKIVSRVVDPATVDEWMTKIEDMQQDIDEVLQEEKEEKQLAQAEMQVTRGSNLINHESEIMARPRRTWFESEKEKKEAKKVGRAELNGPDASQKKEKRKLSGKDKKKLDDHRERKEGKLWKKGKDDKPANGKAKRGKKPTKKRK